MEFPRLKTTRLVLRQFALSDAAEVQRLAGDRAIADTTLEIPHPYEDGMAEQWIATHVPKFEAGEQVALAITLADSSRLVGAVGLAVQARFDRAEIGYWVGKPYWGRGYCTEASRAVVGWAFAELKLNRIFATHFKRNPASGRVMQKLGMTEEGLLRQHIKKWDRYDDLVIYGLVRSEWSASAAPAGPKPAAQ
ncbi:MAG: GNAT family N-acetyltransferase [bacterium]